jgi:hypothetical protein
MTNYILINPFNNKPICFSQFKDEKYIVGNTKQVNGQTVTESQPAICIEADYDLELLNKTYNPETSSFN